MTEIEGLACEVAGRGGNSGSWERPEEEERGQRAKGVGGGGPQERKTQSPQGKEGAIQRPREREDGVEATERMKRESKAENMRDRHRE